VDDSGFSEDTRQTTGVSSRVQQSNVFRTMIGARGPYNLGGSAIVLECDLWSIFYTDLWSI
jgi:hypothetical protein